MMGGVATTLREDTILERVLLYRRRKKVLRLIFFFFLNPFLSAFLLFSSRVVSRARSNVETREELKINLIDTFPRGFSREEHAIRR